MYVCALARGKLTNYLIGVVENGAQNRNQIHLFGEMSDSKEAF
jgi:hypothetical protein